MVTCSICGEIGHNKKTCPKKPIEDTRSVPNEEYIEEIVNIEPKRDLLIKDLLNREAYDIHPQLFIMWMKSKRPISLKELRYLYDKGLSRDSLQIYLDIINDIDEYY